MGRGTGRRSAGGERGVRDVRGPRGPGDASGRVTAPFWWSGVVGALVIIVAGIAAYANSFAGLFVLDDQITIIHNPLIRQVWPLSRFFSSSQPLTELSLAINYSIGGLNPWGYHFFNLCVHLLAGLTLFGVIRRTLLLPSMARWAAGAFGVALMAALLWLVHPLQTESVTYIIQRCESMAGLFYLLTLYCFIRYAGGTHGGGWMWGAAAVFFCACGMATKPIVVTAPVVVLLYDRTFLAGGFGPAIRRRWLVHAGLAATWLVLLALGTFHGLINESPETATVGFGYQGVTPVEYLRTQPEILLHYLRLAVWPVGQCLDYGWPVRASWQEAMAPTAIVVAMLLATCWGTWRKSPVGFAGCWFFLILLPTSSIVPIKDLAFEHRMYLPLAAVMVVLVLGLRGLGGRLRAGRNWPAMAVLGVWAMALVVMTNRRNSLYADSVGLWADNVAKAPHQARGWNALGYAWLTRREAEKGIENFRKAIQLNGDFAAAYANMGKAYFSMGRMEDAVREFRISSSLKPGEFLADTHFYFGSALLQTGRHDEAISQFQLAIGKNPEYREAYYNLANALWALEDRERAAAVFQQALKVDPGYLEAAVNLGLVKAEQGRFDEAAASYRNAIGRFRPGGSQDALMKAHYNLGLALRALGKNEEAVGQFRQALRINPGHEASKRALENERVNGGLSPGR